MNATKERLRATPFDPALTPGARNAVERCLRIQPREKVTLITDRACSEIAAAFVFELDRLHLRYHPWLLEDLSPRPLAEMPYEILDDMETSDVSVFAVKAQENELRTRMQMTDVVNRRKMRHAHMVNIDRRIMLEGMRADFDEVDRISTQVWQMASQAREIRATSPAGTEIVGRFSPQLSWLKTSGIISPHKWGNLPGGETFTTPERVDGTFVIDGVVGDYLCEKYGDLGKTPLTIEVSSSRLREARCANRELREEFWRYCHTDENSDRVGEFAIGTNIGVRDVIGNILQDEKIPGIHIAFGNPYGAHTGADWYSATHIDVVGRKFDIWIDGRQIMRGGAFLLDSLTPPVV
ncbi:MAG TPA: aminopeptidase [Candidatus Sulfopaludibacter sp.]|nr:aminopeptidase [Candidatus Sulfopaludibacter sp.]